MVWYFLLWALQLHANALLDSSSAKPSVSPVTNQGRMHTHAHSKRVWIPESVSCVHCLCAVSLHLLTSSRNTVSLYSATSFLIEIFGKWVVGLQRQAAVALEASDFPELSGCLATSCSDHKSRLLLESTVRQPWKTLRLARHHNPMPARVQVPTLYFPHQGALQLQLAT